MKLAAIFSLTIALIYILLLSLMPSFYLHLYPDIFVFFDRADYFWQHQNFTNLGHNEYQPGALAFFALLSPVFFINHSEEGFKTALFIANTVLIYLTAYLMLKSGRTKGIFLLSLSLIFLGPIILIRFDMLTVFLLYLAFILFEKNKFTLSMAVLSFAVIVKVYPVIFLPYLLFLIWNRQGLKTAVFHLCTFLTAFLLYLLSYTFFFRISLFDTYVSFNYHNLKSVGTESVWATLIYIQSLIQNRALLPIESAYGINAIDRNYLSFPIWLYNYFWVLPFGVIHVLYFLKNRKEEKINYHFIFFTLIIFLVFSKVLSNQYLAWFLLLLPIIDIKKIVGKTWTLNLFLIFLTTIFHTFIFPLHYSEWLSLFSPQTLRDNFLLWIGLSSNLILLLLPFTMAKTLGNKNEK